MKAAGEEGRDLGDVCFALGSQRCEFPACPAALYYLPSRVPSTPFTAQLGVGRRVCFADLYLGIRVGGAERCQSESHADISSSCHVGSQAPSRRHRGSGFLECAGCPELSWIPHRQLGPQPRIMQVHVCSQVSSERGIGTRGVCGPGRGGSGVGRTLLSVRTQAIEFCRKPALLPTEDWPGAPGAAGIIPGHPAQGLAHRDTQ